MELHKLTHDIYEAARHWYLPLYVGLIGSVRLIRRNVRKEKSSDLRDVPGDNLLPKEILNYLISPKSLQVAFPSPLINCRGIPLWRENFSCHGERRDSVVKVKCKICGDIGYTASPKAIVCKCGGRFRVIRASKKELIIAVDSSVSDIFDFSDRLNYGYN